MMAAGEGGEKSRVIGSPLQGEPRKLESSYPAFCSLHQGCQIGCREVDAHYRLEKFGCLAVIKTEISSAYLYQLPSRSQARKGKRRVRACSQDEVYLGGQ